MATLLRSEYELIRTRQSLDDFRRLLSLLAEDDSILIAEDEDDVNVEIGDGGFVVGPTHSTQETRGGISYEVGIAPGIPGVDPDEADEARDEFEAEQADANVVIEEPTRTTAEDIEREMKGATPEREHQAEQTVVEAARGIKPASDAEPVDASSPENPRDDGSYGELKEEREEDLADAAPDQEAQAVSEGGGATDEDLADAATNQLHDEAISVDASVGAESELSEGEAQNDEQPAGADEN